MAALKIDDKVKVKDGDEHNPSHAGAVGTVKSVSGTTVKVTFAGVDGVHTYEADQLVKQ